eukprot:11004523-Ditylum_brightwellii.AAC.1
MKIAKDFSKETIQLVATKKPPIVFEVDASTDQKLGESRTYKLCTTSEEDSSPAYLLTVERFELGSPKEWLIFKCQVKQVLKGQNIGNIDATCTLV